MAIQCKVERITPTKAKAYLEQNTGNFRSVDHERVNRYSGEMRLGTWEVNGEGIKFAIDGTLLDGQHRLLGVVESGVSVDMLVIRNVEASAKHLDRGKPRTLAQWLRHVEIKNAIDVASVSRNCVAHDKGLWKNRSWPSGAVLDSEVLDFAMQYHEAINATVIGSTIKNLPMSIIGTVLFIGSAKKDANENIIASWFREKLQTGLELKETDPVTHLRSRIQASVGSARMPNYLLRYLTTIAWNKTVLGESCTSNGLRVRLTGPAAMVPPEKILVAE